MYFFDKQIIIKFILGKF